jgi:hypothetical protein
MINAKDIDLFDLPPLTISLEKNLQTLILEGDPVLVEDFFKLWGGSLNKESLIANKKLILGMISLDTKFRLGRVGGERLDDREKWIELIGVIEEKTLNLI